MRMRFGLAIVACIGFLGAGCTAADFLFGPLPTDTSSNTDLELGITIVQPSQAITTAEGVKTIVQVGRHRLDRGNRRACHRAADEQRQRE